jgi:uncharacterized protein (DUF1501 family)
MFSRRDFLKSSTLLALAPTVPGFLAQTAYAARNERDGRALVVLQLDGGNDGLNTVVPFADDNYARYRKRLRVAEKELLKINDHFGLHPALRRAGKLLESGHLAIVQGVGYPNPSRSHFRSMAIWHTAHFDREEHNGLGWLGRALDTGAGVRNGEPGSLFVGLESPPVALRGRRSSTSALSRLEDFAVTADVDAVRAASAEEADELAAFVRRTTLDAYATAERMREVARAQAGGVSYPDTGLANRFRLIARLLKAGLGTRVFYKLQASYDTHAQQSFPHAFLLGELASALGAFFDDLTAAKLADRVLVLAFSEFGRTVKENASGGTDHGTTGPVFLAGPGVKSGLVGTAPSLTDLQDGEPKMTVDFRRVYATVLREWLGLDPTAAIGGTFEPLTLFGKK